MFKKTKYYKFYLKDVKKFVEGIPDGIEITCVGSGPGYYGIDFEDCQMNGFNLCTAPSSFDYAYRILQQYKYKLREGCIVILVICPMSFGKNNAVNKKNYSDKYYYFLDKKFIDNYSSVRAFFLNRPIVVILRNKIINYFSRFKSRIFKIEQKNLSTVNVWINEFELKDLKDANQVDQHEESFVRKRTLLSEEIHFLREHGVSPVLLVPPIPEITRKEISEGFIRGFLKENIDMVREETGVMVLNYYDDDRIKQEMFRNDIFLSEEGKVYFSKLLMDDIKGIGVSGNVS